MKSCGARKGVIEAIVLKPTLHPRALQAPKSCYNETLHEDCEWAQWQQRMASKLGGSPSFRFVLPACCSSGPEEGSSGETLSLD